MESKTIGKEVNRISQIIETAYTSVLSRGATISEKDEKLRTSEKLTIAINSLVGSNVTFDDKTGILRIVTYKGE